MANPEWQKKANARVEKLVTTYRKSLRAITTALAQSRGDESVLVSHVNAAKETLERDGIENIPFFQRIETEMSAGTALLGLSISANDIVCRFPGNPDSYEGATNVLFSMMVFLGLGLVFHALARRRRPKASAPDETPLPPTQPAV